MKAVQFFTYKNIHSLLVYPIYLTTFINHTKVMRAGQRKVHAALDMLGKQHVIVICYMEENNTVLTPTFCPPFIYSKIYTKQNIY